MYNPSDDSFLLLETLKEYRGETAMEIGIGSGIISNYLCNRFHVVISTDIDLSGLKRIKKDPDISNNINLICCHSCTPIINTKFDLVVSNPPYLPDDKDFNDKTIHGGKKGIETLIIFLKDALPLLKKNGKIVCLISSFSEFNDLYKFTNENNLQIKKIKEKKLFFEILYVYEISKK